MTVALLEEEEEEGEGRGGEGSGGNLKDETIFKIFPVDTD